MNDKCAGGTGAVIDKINAKLRIPSDELCQHGLRRHQAAPGGRQVRRLRRDRHQRPAEARRAARRADGLAVRGHRAAELVRADARQHAAPAGAAAGRAQHLHPGHAGRLAGQHPQDLGGAQGRRCPKASTRRPDQGPGERASTSPRSARSNSARTRTTTSAVYRGYEKLEWYIDVGRVEEKKKKGGAAGLRKTTEELEAFKERYQPKKFIPATFQPGAGGRRLHRHRRRLDLHQGRAAVDKDKRRSWPRPTSSPRAIRSRTRWTCSPTCASRSSARAPR